MQQVPALFKEPRRLLRKDGLALDDSSSADESSDEIFIELAKRRAQASSNVLVMDVNQILIRMPGRLVVVQRQVLSLVVVRRQHREIVMLVPLTVMIFFRAEVLEMANGP